MSASSVDTAGADSRVVQTARKLEDRGWDKHIAQALEQGAHNLETLLSLLPEECRYPLRKVKLSALLKELGLYELFARNREEAKRREIQKRALSLFLTGDEVIRKGRTFASSRDAPADYRYLLRSGERGRKALLVVLYRLWKKHGRGSVCVEKLSPTEKRSSW